MKCKKKRDSPRTYIAAVANNNEGQNVTKTVPVCTAAVANNNEVLQLHRSTYGRPTKEQKNIR